MDSTAKASDETQLVTTVSNLHISDAPESTSDPALFASNPWKEGDSETKPDNATVDTDVKAESTPVAEPPKEAEEGLHPEASTEGGESASKEVLENFNPLAGDEEEKAAKDAWEASEANPPINVVPPPPAPVLVPEPVPISPSSPRPQPDLRPASPPTFPSLASLARTFALPLPHVRKRSLDTAVLVPSPATLSSFASQQQQPPLPEEPAAEQEAEKSQETDGGSSSESQQDSSSRTDTGKRKESDAPPFDFQKFLDQMKMKSAEPVAKYLRSFLSNFAKRTFTVNDQVKLIHDFLGFISEKMRESDIWRNASDAEFDNAMEGMEKLVMNRLYEFTFSPAVVRMVPPRPVTADDLERDRILSQRVALFGWIEEKHLDVPQGEGSQGFLMFAQQELVKINHYKAPRDKLICILNCCKVIFGLLRHLHAEESADAFLPILIFVVLKANPEHLLSNVEFISRFRNPARLQSEAGYYLSSLMGAISFIETMDHSSLSNITQEEFERNVENAIQSLPPSHRVVSRPSTPGRTSEKGRASPGVPTSPYAGEEDSRLLSLSAPGLSISDDARRLLQKTGDSISKPLNALGRILNEAIDGVDGKMNSFQGAFSPFELGKDYKQDQGQGSSSSSTQWSRYPGTSAQGEIPQTPVGNRGSMYDGGYNSAIQTPYKQRIRRTPSSMTSSASFSSDNTPSRSPPFGNQAPAIAPSQSMSAAYPQPPRVQSLAQSESDNTGVGGPHLSRTSTPNLDLAGMQDEIDREHERRAEAAKETLKQIFPGTDNEIIDWVLEANDGDLGKSIEALLEMSSGT